MLFSELSFFLFFAVCFGVHWALQAQRWRRLWLLACSYFFYGFWDWRFLSLLLGVSALNFFLAELCVTSGSPRLRRAAVVLALGLSLGVLGFFKYYGFFVESAVDALALLGVTASPERLGIILPVGISFFTFQALSYTVDVYRGTLAPTRSFLDFALYTGFFPQLVAGPIVRASDFLPQLERRQRLRDIGFRAPLALFAIGMFKKACIADNVALAIDPIFATPGAYAAGDLALAAVGYSVQIYCDFSAYSDMAIASAALLGYQLRLNFRFPFFSPNVREFWRRWHISLSTWLRDYLYFSLGGNRGPGWKTQRNLLITMVLGGLWHGAAMTFVVWGTLHGLALLVHRRFEKLRPRTQAPSGLGTAVATLATFVWVVFCFTIFRCASLEIAFEFFAGLATFGAARESALSLRWVVLFAGLGLVHWQVSRNLDALHALRDRVRPEVFACGYGVFWAGVLFLMPTNASPFIYFQF